MAQTLVALPCPRCTSLVTVSGNLSDAILTGRCPNPGCHAPMSIRQTRVERLSTLGVRHVNVGLEPDPSQVAFPPVPPATTPLHTLTPEGKPLLASSEKPATAEVAK